MSKMNDLKHMGMAVYLSMSMEIDPEPEELMTVQHLYEEWFYKQYKKMDGRQFYLFCTLILCGFFAEAPTEIQEDMLDSGMVPDTFRKGIKVLVDELKLNQLSFD